MQIFFENAFLSKIRKIPEFCSVYEYQNFQVNLGIFKINFGFFQNFSEYFIEISRIIKRILFFYFENSKIFQKNQNAIAKQNSGIFELLVEMHFEKKFALSISKNRTIHPNLQIFI